MVKHAQLDKEEELVEPVAGKDCKKIKCNIVLRGQSRVKFYKKNHYSCTDFSPDYAFATVVI